MGSSATASAVGLNFMPKISKALRQIAKTGEKERRVLENAQSKSWAVYVETRGDSFLSSYDPTFRSGNQYFSFGYTFSGDKDAKAQAQWFVKMFLKALTNIGVDIKKRSRR
jgi:hypothetical protein